jgi:hypothetical protein
LAASVRNSLSRLIGESEAGMESGLRALIGVNATSLSQCA